MKLIHGDTLEKMALLPDGSIDLILADLPYGTTQAEWDNVLPFEELWEQYRRLIKPNGAIILFSQQPFTTRLIASNYKMFRYEIIWNKVRTTGFLNSKRMPMKQHENILVFYKKLPTYNPQMTEGKQPSHSRGPKATANNRVYGQYDLNFKSEAMDTNLKFPTDILTVANKVSKGQLHPTQKPVEVLEWLIKTYSEIGDTVLDNVMGSGSTGVAASNTGRNFIGIEIDDEYFEIAKNRIEARSNS